MQYKEDSSSCSVLQFQIPIIHPLVNFYILLFVPVKMPYMTGFPMRKQFNRFPWISVICINPLFTTICIKTLKQILGCADIKVANAIAACLSERKEQTWVSVGLVCCHWPGCLCPLWHHKGSTPITVAPCTLLVVRVAKKDLPWRIQIIYL